MTTTHPVQCGASFEIEMAGYADFDATMAHLKAYLPDIRKMSWEIRWRLVFGSYDAKPLLQSALCGAIPWALEAKRRW